MIPQTKDGERHTVLATYITEADNLYMLTMDDTHVYLNEYNIGEWYKDRELLDEIPNMKMRHLMTFEKQADYFDKKLTDFHVRDSKVKEGLNANKRLIALFIVRG